MPLKDYSTQISAEKSVAQIMAMLREQRANAIVSEYDDQGNLEGLSFTIDTDFGRRAYRLPARVGAVYDVLQRQKDEGRIRSRIDLEQATRTSWRIIRDWVAAQCALLETEMVDLEEVMLPYMLTDGRQTVYEAFIDGGMKMLASGNGSSS